MVDEGLATDLLRFGTKVLVLGDPFQLPPVQGAGYFTSNDPDVMLTEIHRQAADNPIIRMSMEIREGGYLEYGRYDDSIVVPRSEVDRDAVVTADQVLVGRNKTRVDDNDRLRELKNLPRHEPVRVQLDWFVRTHLRLFLIHGTGLCALVLSEGRSKGQDFSDTLQPL